MKKSYHIEFNLTKPFQNLFSTGNYLFFYASYFPFNKISYNTNKQSIIFLASMPNLFAVPMIAPAYES